MRLYQQFVFYENYVSYEDQGLPMTKPFEAPRSTDIFGVETPATIVSTKELPSGVQVTWLVEDHFDPTNPGG